MKVAVLIVSRNRPDLVTSLSRYLAAECSIDHDTFVVDAHTVDDELRGDARAHNVALEEARRAAKEAGEEYDYYWALTDDLAFEEGQDAMATLVEQMEASPELAVLAPACENGATQGSQRRAGGGWRPVTTCDYLGFMIRAEFVATVGFLNPDFRQRMGAITELSYLCYGQGWTVAYSDEVACRQLGEVADTGSQAVPADENEQRAKRFAYSYFSQIYGPRWSEVFWNTARKSTHGARIEIDTYAAHREHWAPAFTEEERASIDRPVPREASPTDAVPAASSSAPLPSRDVAEPVKLHLGCGSDIRPGWVNVDVDGTVDPDIVAPLHSLPMLADSSCSVIEASHVLERLVPDEARAALKEWKRLLTPDGELRLELPNLARCIEMVGTEIDGRDVGLLGLFGDPWTTDDQRDSRAHRWGWTPETLTEELSRAGFASVEEVSIAQAAPEAAGTPCNMRLVARLQGAAERAAAAGVPDEPMRTVLAWPDYRDAAALDSFFDVFARVLTHRENVGLFFRVDPELDPPTHEIVAALDSTHARILGPETPLQSELLDGQITPEGWRAIGKHFTCRIQAASDAPYGDSIRMVPAPVVGDADSLHDLVIGGPRGSLVAEGVERDATLAPRKAPKLAAQTSQPLVSA